MDGQAKIVLGVITGVICALMTAIALFTPSANHPLAQNCLALMGPLVGALVAALVGGHRR